MRYTVEVGDGDDHDWNVWDTQTGNFLAYRVSKAEAHIIAFALNAVASGESLQRVGYWMDGKWHQTQGPTVMYTGPTDGIT